MGTDGETGEGIRQATTFYAKYEEEEKKNVTSAQMLEAPLLGVKNALRLERGAGSMAK